MNNETPNPDETSNEAASRFETGKAHAKRAADELKAAASAKAQELKESATAKAQEFRQTASAKAQEFRQSACAKANEWRDYAQDYYGTARDRAKTFQDDSETYIRENPMRAVVTALGVGFVLGILFRR
jgi:ElaB/YqjD/DUF883 family membrane-anchored ribosome-binding protein